MARERWEGKRDELLLVNAATDRELDDFTHRDSAMQTRATVLIGAASLVGAVKLGQGFDVLAIINLTLSFLAAGCGVVVLFPRSGKGPSPRTMWDEIYNGKSDEEALHHMIRVKVKALEANDRSLLIRSWFARVGFILLAASVLVAAIGASIPSEPTSGETKTMVAFDG